MSRADLIKTSRGEMPGAISGSLSGGMYKQRSHFEEIQAALNPISLDSGILVCV